MPRKQKVITNFSGMSEIDFPDAIKKIVTGLTSNSGSFPELPVPAADMETARSEYEGIRLAPYYDTQAAELAAKRTVIQEMVRKNGNYINTLAKGDLVLLEKSGFPISKIPSKQGVLPKTVLTLSIDNQPKQLGYFISGAIVNGITFAIFFTPVTNTETNHFKWQFNYCPKRKGIIKGLESKVDYKFVSVALGTDETLIVSDIVIKAAS